MVEIAGGRANIGVLSPGVAQIYSVKPSKIQ
jgi:hypothetical protein